MGTRAGNFTSREGREYLVEFTGDSVKNADITFSVPPVVISMAAGEHKFCGFKSTTAVVNITTSKALYDLYTETPDGVRLVVTDVTEGRKVEFDGFVVPFSFDQARTGVNDVVTINAVDRLTARKNAEYDNVGDVYGVDRSALEIVQEICRRSGVYKLVVHNNFNTPDDVMSSASPLDVMVAQAGFLQDAVSEVDALSAICKFFGYTGHVVGDTLYLYDEHCLLREYGANRYEYANLEPFGAKWRLRDHWLSDEDSPLSDQGVNIGDGDILEGMTMSIERAYDGIQITPEGSEESILLPDVCADENVRVLEGSEEYTVGNDNGVEYRMNLDSRCMQLGSNDIGPTDEDYIIRDDWKGAAVLMRVSSAKRGKVKLGDNEITFFEKGETGNYILVRSTNDYYSSAILVGKQWEGCTYSHTGGLARLELKYRFINSFYWNDITKTEDMGEETGMLNLVRIDCGDKCLRYDLDEGTYYNHWISKSAYRGATGLLTRGYDLLPTGSAQILVESGAIFAIPSSGAISVSIEFAGLIYGYKYDDCLISSLSLKGYGEPIDLNCTDLKYIFRAGGDILEVGTMLTTRSNGVDDITRLRINARPGVVTSEKWVGGYNGGSAGAAIPIAGVLMEQLKDRYREPRYAYTFDARKRIVPYRAIWVRPITSAVYQATHTVESYDWDLYEDTTKVTIN